jgi:hypothetical protein
MHARRTASAISPRHVEIDVPFAHFHLIEPVAKTISEDRLADRRGLLKTWPGRIRCVVASLASRAALDVSYHPTRPDIMYDDYDDVVESSYESPCGQLSVADWLDQLILPLPPLPPGRGTYRVRYHTREPRKNNRTDCLIQIWPEDPGAPSELKITTGLGQLWHPAAKFRARTRLGSVRGRAHLNYSEAWPDGISLTRFDQT